MPIGIDLNLAHERGLTCNHHRIVKGMQERLGILVRDLACFFARDFFTIAIPMVRENHGRARPFGQFYLAPRGVSGHHDRHRYAGLATGQGQPLGQSFLRKKPLRRGYAAVATGS